MTQTTTAIPAFDYLPEVIALGRVSLQRLSDEWLETPAAKKHGVKLVAIEEDNGRPFIENIGIEVLHEPGAQSPEPQSVYFPVYEMVDYIIERGVSAPEARLRLKQIVRARRDRAGETYQRNKKQAPRQLFIRCKNATCQAIFRTRYSILPGQKCDGNFEPFVCSACGTTNPLAPGDFFVLDAPEEKPVNITGPLGESEKWFSILIRWRPSIFSLIAPLVSRINRDEFEGHAPETVFFLGPQGSSSLPLGRLYFAYRDQSFNKVFRKETENWEEVRHAATNKTLYELADFSVLASLKIESLELIESKDGVEGEE